MTMNRTAVEEIKARIPIEELIGSYVKLEKAGKAFKARCPFHNEKTASFFVSPDRGGYYCFGCNAKGDIFSFVEQFEGLDFRGALKILAERAGVKLTYDRKADGERDRLYQIMEEAAKYFEAQLEKSSDAASIAAREYIKTRGVTDATRKEFRIGWVPEGWQNLIDHLRKLKFSDALIEKAGLGKKTEEGKFYDRFRGRVMFPITDSSGRVIAFTGRILKDDGKSAKYLNSPDMPLYNKSLILYGLDKAKSEIRRLNYSIFVEGQMDLVMSHQAGIKNTVAASGTALTDEAVSAAGVVSNLGLVRRLSPNVIIAFDSDAAGRKAALRAAGIALSMGMDVKVADIVGGKDPADLVKEDIEKWKQVLRAAKPVIEFELDNVLLEQAGKIGGKGATDGRKAAKAITERVLPLVARIESSSDQSHFITMIADRAKLPIDSVWQDVKVVAARLKKEEASSATSPSGQSTSTAGANSNTPNARTSSEIPRRIDLIERRLFGLLALMAKEKTPERTAKVEEYKELIRKAAGATYEARAERARAMVDDLLFEAEAFFGNDEKHWEKHMRELLANFEEDLMNEELMTTMQELRAAEKAGNVSLVGELAKKCQALSVRKAEVGKRRRE
jgi:DNA primase